MLTRQHQRVIRSVVAHTESKLAEIECLLESSEQNSVFSGYLFDLSSEEREAVRAGLKKVRELLRKGLANLGVSPAENKVSARWAICSTLSVLCVVITELGDGRLARYGPVDTADLAAIETMRKEVETAIAEISDQLCHTNDPQ